MNATLTYEESPPVAMLGVSAETSLQPDSEGGSAWKYWTLGANPQTRRRYTCPPSPQATIPTPSPDAATAGTPAPVPASSDGTH